MDVLRRGRARAEFERFVDAHADQLLRTGFLVTGDPVEAEDLVQECLLRVARHWPRARSMDQPAAYARRILVNLALDDARRRTRCAAELGWAEDSPVEARANGASAVDSGLSDTRMELIAGLRMLPARQRAILILRYYEDLSEAQVAHLLSCSVGTVKSTASRGLSRLREALDTAISADSDGGHISRQIEKE